MSYLLKENLTGEPACFETKLRVDETEKKYIFFFEAKNSTFYCPHKGYNKNLYEGDVCEIFIGNADTPRDYYEIEISPDGDIFLAKVDNQSTENKRNLKFTLIQNEFLQVETKKYQSDYTVKIEIDKQKLNIAHEKIAFNAFRIETEGKVRDLHLFSLNPTRCEAFHKLGSFVLLKDYLK